MISSPEVTLFIFGQLLKHTRVSLHLRRRLDSKRVRYAEFMLFLSAADMAAIESQSLFLTTSFRLRLLNARGMSQRQVRKHGQLLDRSPTACFAEPLTLF